MTYQPPVRDHMFLLRDVLNIEQYGSLPAFADASIDVVEQIVEGAAQFTGEVLAPLNSVGDKTGCKLDPVTNTVTTPPGFKEAYKALCEGGWTGLGSDPTYGGQGLPHVVNLSFSEMSSSANMAFSMYPGLAHGAYSAIHTGGTDEQKQTYLPKMITGEWTGTMNLTEPHCGTDLGLLRTKAVPQADGSYKITGQKIWISAGEHDMSDNIVHLVLARIEGAPAGVKGISLFIVPKFFPKEDGSVGARNEGAKCVGLEEKMGIHGNATCVMQYDDAEGYLIGEENSGLKLMFVMMNEARLGRSLTGPKNADGPADPIIVHPDVRRLLLENKAIIEGGRAFLFWTALHGDLAHAHPDEAVRTKAEDYMGLLTPVLKGYLTDRGFQVCSNAVQVHGGSGFTEHFPVSQYLRDCRIALIYEGTNGVQALDLVGRKLAAKGGRGVMTFFQEIDQFVGENDGDAELKPFIDALAATKGQLQDGTMWLMQNGLQNPDNAGAASTDYMHLFGLTGLAYMWALMVKAANAKIAEGSTDPFFTTKVATARYFIERVLPDAGAHLAKLKTGSATLMALPAEAF
jgi:alkylation response protein AidB-like acyl-CoA dehydrogenase